MKMKAGTSMSIVKAKLRNMSPASSPTLRRRAYCETMLDTQHSIRMRVLEQWELDKALERGNRRFCNDVRPRPQQRLGEEGAQKKLRCKNFMRYTQYMVNNGHLITATFETIEFLLNL